MSTMPVLEETSVAMESVLCIGELDRRPTRVPDYASENRTLVALARALTESPQTILQTVADTVLQALRCGSACISVETADEQRFSWSAVAGDWKLRLGDDIPRDASPCGEVLDRNIPLMFRRPERRYTSLRRMRPRAEECLLVPFHVNAKAVGAIWAVIHNEHRKFDAEDKRQLEALSTFASLAWQTAQGANDRDRESATRRSEEELRDFVENVAVALHRVGADGTILWANRAELEMLGYTRDQYIGHHVAEFHDDEVMIADILERLKNRETLNEHEARLRCSDGSIRHVLVSSNVLWSGDEFVHTRCCTRDITEQKVLEQAQHDSERQFREMIDALPAAVYTTDAHGRLTHFNPACVAFSGRTPELGNDHWCVTWKLYYPDGTPMRHDQCPMAIALKEGYADNGVEAIAERPDGTRIWFEPYPMALRDATGAIVGGINMLVDITARKEAEEVVHALNAQLSSDLDAMARMQLFSTRLIQAGDFSMLLQEILDAAIEITDAQMGTIQLLKGDALQIVSQRGFAVPFLDFFRTVKSGFATFDAGERMIVEDVESSPVFADASVREVMLAANSRAVQSTPLFGRNGQALGVLSTHYHTPQRPSSRGLVMLDVFARQAADLIEHRHAVERLREAKREAEDANRAKDTFLAMLSHELRTPLTPALLALSALESKPALSSAVRDDVKMIRRNIELEGKLIDDLLDLSRITNGKLRLTFDVLDINELVRHACDICRSRILEKGIHLHSDLAEGATCVVGDTGRLQQVLWNLLNNAAKFTPEGGHIYVTTGTDDRQVKVTVRDTGIGIALESLSSIFDAFAQGDVGVARQFGGMGLGLAICKVLVERHEGTILARSDGLNKGATFTVELPATSAEQSAVAAAATLPVSNPTMPIRLLVVDDNIDTTETLGVLLSCVGYTVEKATTATDALSLASMHPFDIIISDLGLPDMTGYELMKQIKAKHGIKGIAMSGYGMEEDLLKSKAAGFDDHLVKPVAFEQLEQSLHRVARSLNIG